jgi:prevent-host-death family protein
MGVSVRELKDRLSFYLRKVRRGDRIVVTDRGEPVAELRAVERRVGDVARRLGELAASGDVTPPSRGARRKPGRAVRLTGGAGLARAIIDDRGPR